ncbi:MAG: DMT family transporter [Rhodobacteraceae bacterium]|nr:DMT family transporter [Paracoccaceae bacterium]
MTPIPRPGPGPAPLPDPAPQRDNLRGAAWLLADMGLNIWALAIVKAMGADFPAVQIVCIRALTGLVLLSPFLWQGRAELRTSQPGLHAMRVALSATAIVTSFYAVARLPLALFTAISFTRPLIMMAMAALILREVVRPAHWLAGMVGLAGVLVAVQPGEIAVNSGLWALMVTIFAGTGAIIVTRKMREESALVMMLAYTAGIGAVTALPAALTWQAPGALWPVLLLIGAFAQAAQYCFLRAHYWGESGVLGPLGYSSLVLSTAVGYFFFAEVPTLHMLSGAAIIIVATLAVTRR